jgi:hypothetical protein
VITFDLATATCTAAATLMLVSSMQPIMHSMPCMAGDVGDADRVGDAAGLHQLDVDDVGARMRISSITSIGPNTLSSAITGVCTRSVT